MSSNTRIMLPSAVAVFGFAAVVLPIYAQESVVSAAQHLARAFTGYCVQNAGRNDKVEAAAKFLGYLELEGDLKTMLAPQDPEAEYAGWVVRDDGQTPYLLGISNAEINGVKYSVCVVADPETRMDDVLSELRSLVNFGRVLEDSEEAGQRYRVWETEEVASRSFISAVDAPRMGVAGGSLSLSAPNEH